MAAKGRNTKCCSAVGAYHRIEKVRKMNELIFLTFSAVAFASRYLCQYKVSLPAFFSKKQICRLPINKKLEGICFCLSYLCQYKVSLPTFFTKKVGILLYNCYLGSKLSNINMSKTLLECSSSS